MKKKYYIFLFLFFILLSYSVWFSTVSKKKLNTYDFVKIVKVEHKIFDKYGIKSKDLQLSESKINDLLIAIKGSSHYKDTWNFDKTCVSRETIQSITLMILDSSNNYYKYEVRSCGAISITKYIDDNDIKEYTLERFPLTMKRSDLLIKEFYTKLSNIIFD